MVNKFSNSKSQFRNNYTRFYKSFLINLHLHCTTWYLSSTSFGVSRSILNRNIVATLSKHSMAGSCSSIFMHLSDASISIISQNYKTFKYSAIENADIRMSLTISSPVLTYPTSVQSCPQTTKSFSPSLTVLKLLLCESCHWGPREHRVHVSVFLQWQSVPEWWLDQLWGRYASCSPRNLLQSQVSNGRQHINSFQIQLQNLYYSFCQLQCRVKQQVITIPLVKHLKPSWPASKSLIPYCSRKHH